MSTLLNIRRFFVITLVACGTLSLSGCVTKAPVETPYAVSLEIWGLFDDSDAYAETFEQYKKLNPRVKALTYRKLPVETYKEDLINAFASGKGPDIFMIRNSWRADFEDKTTPAPENVLTEKDYRERLVDVASSDFINKDKKIYGVPLSVDSLALYYNKDIFNIVGITEPPKTWDEVIVAAQKLNLIDQFGAITRSGVSLGTGVNINRSSDILSVLMMQLGSGALAENRTSALSFNDEESRSALEFYTSFSRVGAPAYSWNARQDYSLDAFYKGNLAMMINYEAIKQKNAKLNIGIAPLPQFDLGNPANVANYYGYVVSKEKPNTIDPAISGQASPVPSTLTKEEENRTRTFESWQFLKYFALAGKEKKMTLVHALSGNGQEIILKDDPAAVYLEATNKPGARRDLLETQKNDLVLAPFAYGNLIAKNWYQGNSEAADGILIDTIDSVVRGEKSIQNALEVAATRINLLKR